GARLVAAFFVPPLVDFALGAASSLTLLFLLAFALPLEVELADFALPPVLEALFPVAGRADLRRRAGTELLVPVGTSMMDSSAPLVWPDWPPGSSVHASSTSPGSGASASVVSGGASRLRSCPPLPLVFSNVSSGSVRASPGLGPRRFTSAPRTFSSSSGKAKGLSI